jgi:hypothetical protein
MAKQTQTKNTKNSTPVDAFSTPLNAVSTPVPTDSTPVNIQTPETPKELQYTRMETTNINHRVKVQFTLLSSRNGEISELDYGLAMVYEKQGKVKIIN